MKTSHPFITTRSQDLSIWQSAVAHTAHAQLLKTQPQLSLASHAVRSDAMVQATNLHVVASNAGTRLATPSQSDFAGKSAAQIDNDHVLQGYLSQAFFEAAQQSGTMPLATAPPEILGFPYSDAAIIAWLAAAGEYAASHPNLLDPSSEQPYVANTEVLGYTLPANAKVVILGDYGTGLPDAIAMISAILTDLQPDCIIHVGDIYYAGMPTECQATIVDVFSNAFTAWGKSIPVFSLPGNHEYLGGGSGFYQLVLPLNGVNGLPSNTVQNASFFCLRTADNNWQFLGMDTGFFSIPTVAATIGPPLHATEVAWLQAQLESFGGNTILCSHHQLFSANAEINSATDPGSYYVNDFLMSYFRPYFPKISAWFWGHEHALGVFQDGLYGLPMGRLVGNSGYEEFQEQNPFAVNNPVVPYASPMVMPGVSTVTWDGDSSTVYNHCCAFIDFTDTTTPAVSYYQFPAWADPTNPPANPALTLIPNGQENLGTSNPHFIGWTTPLPEIGAYATTHLVTAGTADGAPAQLTFASANGVVFVMDGGSGTLLNTNSLPNESGNEIRLLVANSTLFACSASGYVYSLSLDSNIGLNWSSLVNSFKTTTNIAFGNGVLYVGYHGDVAIVNASNGSVTTHSSLQWDLNEEVRLAVNGEYLYAGCYGNVFILDASSLDQTGAGKIDIKGNLSLFNLLVVNGNLYAGSNGYVYGWNADGSNALGTNDLTGSGLHEVRLASDGSYLYVGTNGMIASLDLDDLGYNGNWATPLVSLPNSTTLLDNAVNIICNGGFLYVGCFGNLFKLEAGNGNIDIELDLHGYEVPIGLDGDGICAIFTGNVVTPGTTSAGAMGIYNWQSYVSCVSQDSLT
jgi:Calcineurin-like phosphoesterase